MNDMKERLIDLNYYYIYINRIYNKFIYSIIIKYNSLILILNYILYINIFNNIKYSNILKISTLSDFTVINHIDNIYNFELIYVMLSYKLNLRLILKLFCNKEDLIISISNIVVKKIILKRKLFLR